MHLRDPICSASHLIFAVWAGFALLTLLRVCPAPRARRRAVAVFGGSTVMLIPPGTNMDMVDGHLRLTLRQPHPTPHMPIDHLFVRSPGFRSGGPSP